MGIRVNGHRRIRTTRRMYGRPPRRDSSRGRALPTGMRSDAPAPPLSLAWGRELAVFRLATLHGPMRPAMTAAPRWLRLPMRGRKDSSHAGQQTSARGQARLIPKPRRPLVSVYFAESDHERSHASEPEGRRRCTAPEWASPASGNQLPPDCTVASGKMMWPIRCCEMLSHRQSAQRHQPGTRPPWGQRSLLTSSSRTALRRDRQIVNVGEDQATPVQSPGVDSLSVFGQTVGDEPRDSARSRRVQVGQNRNHIAALRIDLKVAVHSRCAAAMAEMASARVRTLVGESKRVPATAWRLHLPGGQQLRVFRVKQLVIGERARKTLQVLDGGVAAAGGSSAIRKRVRVGMSAIAAERCISNRASSYVFIFWQRGRRCHTRGSVNLFADVVVVAFSAHPLDDHTEQEESIVAVLPAAARHEFQIALSIQVYVILQSAQVFAVLVEQPAKNVSGSAGMGQQLFDADL